MQESMYKYMKVGLIHFMAYPETSKGEGPILETLRRILLDDYFTAVEIAWIKDPETRRKARRMLETSKVTIAYGAHPRLLSTGLNLNDLAEDGRQKALATCKEGIDEACELGAVGFAFLSGKYPETKKQEAFDRLVDSTGELCTYAKTKGNMKVVLEVFDHTIDKKSLIGPADLARKLAEAVTRKHSNFGLLVDLSHIPLVGESATEAILPVREYLVQAHLGNCVMGHPTQPAYGDQHPRFGFPGGKNDVEQVLDFLKVLKDIHFLNTQNPPIVSFEIKPFGDDDPDLVIANAKRTLNEAWARLE